MKLERRIWQSATGSWEPIAPHQSSVPHAQLVLVFGERLLFEDDRLCRGLNADYPSATCVAVSTAGEIQGDDTLTDGATLTAIAFEKTRLRVEATGHADHADCAAAGRELGRRLASEDLAHILVFSDGRIVDGSDLVRGFNEILPTGVRVSGGMAGDGLRFAQTVVGIDGEEIPGGIVAIGLYGDALQVVCGSEGGFRAFGPERRVTRAERGALLELDHEPALDVYKRYLGEAAEDLPASALRFPLAVLAPGGEVVEVRTILTLDHERGSMVFAGDIPENSRVRLMHGTYESVIDGAEHAAEKLKACPDPELVLCISCVGRRMLLGQRAEDELDAIRARVGPRAVMAGFYSYGELAGGENNEACILQNQTMTLTALRER